MTVMIASKMMSELTVSLIKPILKAIAEAANRIGMPFAGHVSDDVGLARALEAGQATIDHLDGYMRALLPPGSDRSVSAGFFGAALIDRVDTSRIPALAKALENKNVAIRMFAAQTLGSIPNKSSIPALRKALKNDTKAKVRMHILQALGNIGGKSVTSLLLNSLKDKSKFVRSKAVYLLGMLRNKKHLPVLIKTLNKDKSVHSAVLQAFGMIGDMSVVPILVKALGEKDVSVRHSAATALNNTGIMLMSKTVPSSTSLCIVFSILASVLYVEAIIMVLLPSLGG